MKIVIEETRFISGTIKWDIKILFDKSHQEFFDIIDWLRNGYIAEQDYSIGFESAQIINVYVENEQMIVAFQRKWL